MTLISLSFQKWKILGGFLNFVTLVCAMSSTRSSPRFSLFVCDIFFLALSLTPEGSFYQVVHRWIILLLPKSFFTSWFRSIGKLVALKVEIQKAYDSISWEFLSNCLLALGFNHTVVHRLMTSVSSTVCWVKVNEALTYPIHPSRALRQGDLISSYLYLIVWETFSRAIRYL